jgi:hypothetical protein
MFRFHRRSLVWLLPFTVFAGACGESVSEPGPARLQILLVDAPSDYIAQAEVDIGRVELLPAGDGDRILLSEDGTDGFVNLLALQGDVSEVLADEEIPVGFYHQLRMIVEDARVVLKDGTTFQDGTSEAALSVPSGAQTGLKLNLSSADGSEEGEDSSEGVEIAGGRTVLVLDFDVNQSFRLQGNPETPAGLKSVSFRPTIRVVVEDLSGSVSGTISTDLTDQPLGGLVVTASAVDPGTSEEFQSLEATGVTSDTGAYTIRLLPPGTYTVTVAAPEGLATDPASLTVEVGASQDVSGQDFALIQAS